MDLLLGIVKTCFGIGKIELGIGKIELGIGKIKLGIGKMTQQLCHPGDIVHPGDNSSG